MNEKKAQELVKGYAEAVNDYRAFLREKIKRCSERLERERNHAISCAECGDFDNIRPDALISFRVELETYEEAARKLEENIENAGNTEGDDDV
jgi:hypothetical protein